MPDESPLSEPPADFQEDPEIAEPVDYTPPDIDHPPESTRGSEYPDWSPETTRIALAPRAHHENWEEARVYFENRYGRVFENCSTARWWAARVGREAGMKR